MEFKDLTFKELAGKIRAQRGNGELIEDPILVFDPGHTTGWAFFYKGHLEEYGQINTDDVERATPEINQLIHRFQPVAIVAEDYRVYKWRQKHHVGSDLLTSRVIGCIETLSALVFPAIPVIKQPAMVAKQFCTDDKLAAWGFFKKGHKIRHAMDAVRHGCYFLIFGEVTPTNHNKPRVG